MVSCVCELSKTLFMVLVSQHRLAQEQDIGRDSGSDSDEEEEDGDAIGLDAEG
eukprot:CAMPEP_0171925028 /NCGR_PEP_ID=MMETSP0993-20121228/23549_1 /TAXON_ID=483369 /ORGANISM="non described non described, Strain CCMP2098" /LENGTH=52 /DNA_ID=CAMNT_0012563469 /DNA_START=145 /DNA_END=299 /DNA_ORIENTATION=+